MGASLLDGLIVAPPNHVPAGFVPGAHALEVCTGSHPSPDERSLAAGERVTEFIAALPSDAQLLCLVSGGASSLVERLVPGGTLADLQTLNRWALQSGASIERVNALRGALSCLKGGGLRRLAGERRVHALLVSDVPGDDPCVIGSGLLHARATAAEIDTNDLPPELRSLLQRLQRGHSRGTEALVADVPFRVVASIGHACRAAGAAARGHGLQARPVRNRIAGEARLLGAAFAASLLRQPAGVLQIRGGESTVQLPASPGRGGRNQHLALAAALEFDRTRAAGVTLLAAGTDGIDGGTEDAGAIVDAATCARGRDAGFEPRQALDGANSGTFLEAAGDLLHTGPTLTNVGDLVLGLRL